MSDSPAIDPAPDVAIDPAPDTTPAADPAPDVAPADPSPGASPFAQLPDGWRDALVKQAGFEGDDAAKRLGQLDRVQDLGGLTKNYFAAQDKIRSGTVDTGLPEEPTDEQLADYREANGVPAEATGYSMDDLGEGVVLGEEDSRILESVLPIAHAHNLSNGAVSQMVGAMMAGREAEMQAVMQQDGLDKQTTTRQLQSAWGGDFETNLQMAQNLLLQLPEDARSSLMGARGQDGGLIMNNPAIVDFLSATSRDVNPAGTVVPNSHNPAGDIQSRVDQLHTKMKEPGWHSDKASQDELQRLYDAQDKMKARDNL